MIYAAFWGSHFTTILLKYIWQSFSTLNALIRYRPRVVFVMTPPVAACFVVWVYCVLRRAKFVIDAHTGAFLDSPWQKVHFLHRFFSRRAELTIVTSEYLKDLVERWNAKAYIVTDVPLAVDSLLANQSASTDHGSAGAHSSVSNERCMTVVSSFGSDEPIELLLTAAGLLSDVTFYVTGNDRKLSKELVNAKPQNVYFTGFLSRDRYLQLLRRSDAVIALTKSDHTMQRGAYEAIYLGRPVVTSDFPILRRAFPEGAEHVRCEVASIVAGIARIRDNLTRYENDARRLRSKKLIDWERRADELTSILDLPGPQGQYSTT